MGIGIGAKNATVPIYSAEMAPARIRGALVMFWQLWVVAGNYAQLMLHQSDHSLMGFCRHFSGILCQRHREGHGRYLLAASARFSIHSFFHPWRWYLFLPRVSSLVDEALQKR